MRFPVLANKNYRVKKFKDLLRYFTRTGGTIGDKERKKSEYSNSCFMFDNYV